MNILGFNIGQNYKGILNLGSTINTPLSATLQSVTDGMGVASPLQLSTTQVSFDQSSAGYINRWYNSGGTANARKYAVYVANNYWSLTTRNDAEDSGEQFIIATALGGNLSRLELGKSVSPLILSTSLATLASSNLAVGHTTASARLHVRGDGTNSVARFESSAGTTGLFINQNADYLGLIGNTNTGFQFNSNSIDLYTNNAAGSNQGYFRVFGRNSTAINGTTYGVDLGGISLGSTTGFGFTAGAGIANFRPLNLTYTINNSGAQTGTATGIFLNATETALNGMTHNLLDLQVGGVSRFRVANTGVLTLGQAGTYFITLSSQGINFSGGTQQIIVDSNLLLRQQTAGTFGLLQFAGTTNAFPALKRNGAALEVRLADDSNFSSLSASVFNAQFVGSQVAINIFDTTRQIGTGGSGHIGFKATNFTFNNDNFNVANASAIVQIDSTTKGFLPPRMTTTQVNAIATPAEGLVVFNTTISHLCVYQSGAWVKLSHSPM